MFVVQISLQVQRITPVTPWPGTDTHSFTVLSSVIKRTAYYAAEAIRTVLIIIPPGTHYCWVDRGGVNSRLAYIRIQQGCYTLPVMTESSLRTLDPLTII